MIPDINLLKLVYDLRVSLWVLYDFMTTEYTFESPIIEFPYANQQSWVQVIMRLLIRLNIFKKSRYEW